MASEEQIQTPDSQTAGKPPKRRRWRRRLFIAFLTLLALVVVLYFVVTSQAFLGWMIRGQVASRLGGEATVETIDWNLFSHLNVEGLEIVGPAPERDRIRVGHFEVRYSLWSLVRGAPVIGPVTLEGVEAALTVRPDGQVALLSQLPAAEEEAQAPEPSVEGEAMHAQIGPIQLSGISLVMTNQAPDPDEPLVAEVVIDSIETGVIDSQRGIESLSLDVRIPRVEQGDHTHITGGRIHGEASALLQGDGGSSVSSDVRVEGFTGQWRGSSVDDVALSLLADVATDAGGMAQIDTGEIALRRDETLLGRLAVTGAVDTETGDGELAVTLSDITDETLELVCAQPGGIDFGQTRIGGQAQIAISDEGNTVGVDTSLSIADLSVLSPAISEQRTPVLDFQLASSLVVDQAQQRLDLSEFTANGDMAQRRFLVASLDNPLSVVWGEADAPVPAANLTVTLSDIDLAEIRPLLPPALAEQLQRGTVNASSRIAVAEGGQAVTLNGHLNAEQIVLAPTGSPLEPITAQNTFDVQLDLAANRLDLPGVSAVILRQGAEAGRLDVTGDIDLEAGAGSLQVQANDFDLTLPAAAAVDPESLALTSGLLDTDTRITFADEWQTVEIEGQTQWSALDLVLPQVSGTPLPLEEGQIDVAATLRGSDLTLSNLLLNLEEHGRLIASANMTLDPPAGSLEIALEDLALGAIASPLINQPAISDLVANGRQRVQFDQTAETLQVEGEIALRDAIRVATERGEQRLALNMTDSLDLSPNEVRAENTALTLQLGDLPAETITLVCDIDRTGSRQSTVALRGDEVDLSPFAALAGGGGEEAPTPEPAVETEEGEMWHLVLPDLPDPEALRLRGDLSFQRIVYSGLELVEPTVAVAWERLDAASPARRLDVETIDVQIPGEQMTGHLTGSIRLRQEDTGEPLEHALDLTLTETELDPIFLAFAPAAAERISASAAIPECSFEGVGREWPRDMETLRGSAVFELGEGQFDRLLFLRRIAELTQIPQLERIRFFEGGMTLITQGDHLELTPQAPFFVRGDLTMLSATGNLFYDGRQNLTVALGLSNDFPGLGELMARSPTGMIFPESAQSPGQVIFPLPIETSGTWADPHVGFGVPRFDQMFPGLLRAPQIEELLQAPQLLDLVGEVPESLGEVLEMPGQVGERLMGGQATGEQRITPPVISPLGETVPTAGTPEAGMDLESIMTSPEESAVSILGGVVESALTAEEASPAPAISPESQGAAATEEAEELVPALVDTGLRALLAPEEEEEEEPEAPPLQPEAATGEEE
ncbi:DUF748 domain-containing protein [Candidatus Sumerlaeota bacterium]|nr:DUF748 domain-containing protein [Candidatus Sumerlaeota bacterium]